MGLEHRAGLNPVSDEEMYLFLLQSVPDNRRMEEAQWPQLLAAELAEFGGILGRLRESLGPDSRINYRPLENLLLARPWHQGRVLLIGDAAHATTPHLAYGAGLAVEDGLVLGELAQPGVALHGSSSVLRSGASSAAASSSRVRRVSANSNSREHRLTNIARRLRK